MTAPATMRAVVLTGHGGLDKLEYRQDWPMPVPAEGEVLVRVAACGLNNTDINTRTAWYSKMVTEGITDAAGKDGFAGADTAAVSWGSTAIKFPRIQGADVAGKIVAVGDGVEISRIDERVILDPWILDTGDWLDASRSRYFGSECDGGFAEYTTIRSENAIRINTRQSDAELATYPCAYTTAENLIARTGLKPGETVVVTGASGGVGSAAIQLCRLRGARIIAIASSSKADLLKKLGTDQVIDRDTDNLEQAIRDVAGGSVDVALDVIGGSTFTPLINALRQGGRYSSSGSIAGPLVEFDLRQLVYKDLQLTGATIVPPGTMQRLVNLIEQDLLKPLLAQTFPLKELARAQETFLQKKHVGNIVVEI
ncbi:MAG: alcohol dehydrogenase family protein [Gammaproteobacteria bacterium]|nr:alcohol dehydrogenase family protein [Gammaproteobacteria bacterium]MDH3856757.1 alcohol dehydrogenase family protein [Gammaproteobacteria bacterium]